MKTRYNIKEFALICRMLTHPANDNDCIVAVSGSRGVGKSVLTAKIMRQLLGQKFYTKESFEYYCIYQPDELSNKLETCLPNECFMIDEGINVLFKRDFAKKTQKVNIKIFNTHRDKRLIVFILIPNFWDLDSSVRNSLIFKFWIHCYSRGDAWIFTHDHNPGTTDPFSRDHIFRMYSRNMIWKARNFVGNIRWSDMDRDVYDIYKNIKKEKRLKLDSEEETEWNPTLKELAIAINKQNPDLTQTQIATFLNCHINTVNKALRS